MKRRILCLFLSLLIVCGLLGCSTEAGTGTDTAVTTETVTTEAPPVVRTIVADGATEYTIIRSEEASQSDINQAIRLRQAIVDGTGANISLGTDWVKRGVEVPATGLEIVVGDTNRPQTVGRPRESTPRARLGNFLLGRPGDHHRRFG